MSRRRPSRRGSKIARADHEFAVDCKSPSDCPSRSIPNGRYRPVAALRSQPMKGREARETGLWLKTKIAPEWSFVEAITLVDDSPEAEDE
jgi:hypothetical protein